MSRDELVVLIEQPPRDIDPRRLGSSYDYKLSYLTYGRLVNVDSERLEPVMELAREVRRVPAEPGAPDDQVRVDVQLREARFWDGSPVAAADLAYTFERLLDEKTGHPVLRSRFADAGLVRPVTIISQDTVRLTLRHPHASIVTDLDFGVLKRGTAEPGEPTRRPIGAGAFMPAGLLSGAPASSDVGEVTRLVRNPHYFAGAPPMQRLTVRVVRDANSRLLSLLGGSADLTQNSVSPLLFDSIRRWDDRLQLETAPSAIFYYLGMNLEDPHLSDRRVRQAIYHAIDRERIIRTKLRGAAHLATGMLPTQHWAYTDEVPRYAYDPQRARALLDEAGLTGTPRLRLSYKTSTDALPLSIARVIAAQLLEVGIEVEVRPYEFQVFLADVKKGNFQLFTLSSGEVAEPNLYKRYFHSRYIPTKDNPDAGHNRVRYRDQEIDSLLDQGEREMDRQKRREIYAKVQRILARDLPVLPMWHPDNVAVLRRGVRGYRIYPSAQLTSLSQVTK